MGLLSRHTNTPCTGVGKYLQICYLSCNNFHIPENTFINYLIFVFSFHIFSVINTTLNVLREIIDPAPFIVRLEWLVHSINLTLHMSTWSSPDPTHVNMVLPNPTHINMVLSNPTHVNMVLSNPTHVNMVLPNPTHVNMVLPWPYTCQHGPPLTLHMSTWSSPDHTHVNMVLSNPKHVNMVFSNPKHVNMVLSNQTCQHGPPQP